MGLWTYEHGVTLIPALIAMCGIGALLRWQLRKKDLNIRMIPFQILAVVLFLIEVGKQVLSLKEGYDLYHLPFHFCSLFIFMLPAMAFYRGRYAGRVKAVTSALCGAVLLLMLIYPNLIYSAANIREFFTDYFSFHTVAFHNIVLLEFILIVALGLHTPERGEQRAVVWYTVGFCVVSATMAQLLKTNFANYYSCNIPPLEALRLSVAEAIGAVPTQIIYILIVSLLNIGFVLMSYWVYRGLRRAVWGKVTDLSLA